MSLRDAGWTVSGLLVLSVGTAVGAVYMFRGAVFIVVLGVGLIIFGYQIIHYGAHGDGLVRRLSNHDFGHDTTETWFDWTKTVVSLAVGLYLIAQGFVIGAQATTGLLRPTDMAICGLCIVGGYVVSHLGVHGEVL